MADIFEEMAEQEMVHAKTLFKLLEGGEVEITASFLPETNLSQAPRHLHTHLGYDISQIPVIPRHP